MSQNEKRVPDQETTLQELSDLTIDVYQVLDAAKQKSHDFFVSEGDTDDKNFYPHLVRYHTKRALLKEEPHARWRVEILNNNGIHIVYEKFHIKVLKSSKGKLPPAGSSRIRQCFYCQKPLWSLQDLPPNHKDCTSLNLIIHWDTDPVTKMLQLKISCPKYGNVNSAVVHWMQDIKHPIFSINEETAASSYMADLDDDLDISINDDVREDDSHSA